MYCHRSPLFFNAVPLSCNSKLFFFPSSLSFLPFAMTFCDKNESAHDAGLQYIGGMHRGRDVV